MGGLEGGEGPELIDSKQYSMVHVASKGPFFPNSPKSALLCVIHAADCISEWIKGRGPADDDTSEGVPVPVGGTVPMRRKHVLRSLSNDVRELDFRQHEHRRGFSEQACKLCEQATIAEYTMHRKPPCNAISRGQCK